MHTMYIVQDLYKKSLKTIKKSTSTRSQMHCVWPLTKIDDARGRSVRYTIGQFIIIRKTDKRYTKMKGRMTMNIGIDVKYT